MNRMDTEILRSDQVRQDTERLRREWIANITDDLKTPLSPVRGYAELLMENPVLQECEICLDTDLFCRTVNNFIVNALTHNPPGSNCTH